MRILYLVLLIGICINGVFAQDVVSETSKVGTSVTTYDRNAITFILLESSSMHNQALVKASKSVTVPSKFDLNKVPTKSIRSEKSVRSVKYKLDKEKVPNQILSEWFSRNSETGTMDMTIIHDRGLYNATADDISKSSASKVGMAGLKDTGEELINNSYVFVVGVTELLTMEQVYDKRDAALKVAAELFNKDFVPVKRNKNGWKGKVKGYLFKLAFNDSSSNDLYNNMWIYEDDDVITRNLKKAKFEAASFPMAFVMEVDGSGSGTQYNPGLALSPAIQKTKTELFEDLLNSGLRSCIDDVERNVAAFQVKTPVYNDNPITAKIGTKEGVRVDQRYFVIEFEQDRKGNMKANRKGVVRAKYVINNKRERIGKSSEYSKFYQTAGFNIEPGMLMQQKPDFGIGVSSGFCLIGRIRGPYLKAELNVSKALTNGPNQIKFFGMAGFDIQDYSFGGDDYSDVNFARWQLGISKGFYFARNFSVAPFISYGMEHASHNDFESYTPYESITTHMMDFGAYGTINILHNLQAIGTLNLFAPIGYAIDHEGAPIEGKMYAKDYFIDRKGLTIDVGLRLEL